MAAGDLCELDDVKAADNLATDTFDDLIRRWITAASTAIRGFAGREFAATAPNPQTRTFDVGPWARDREVPVGDLADDPTAVTVIDSEGVLVYTVTVATEVVALPLVREPEEPITSLRLRSAVPLAPSHQLTVAGEWGFPAVPADVTEACVEAVKEWLGPVKAVTRSGEELDDSASGAVSRALPNRSRMLLRPYRVPVVG